jgi:hypothetical protein
LLDFTAIIERLYPAACIERLGIFIGIGLGRFRSRTTRQVIAWVERLRLLSATLT